MRETFGEVWRKAINHGRFYNRQEQDVVCKPFQETGPESEPGLTIGGGQVSRAPRERKAAGGSSRAAWAAGSMSRGERSPDC